MKKLLFISIALAMIFTACDNPAPQPEEPVNEEASVKDYYPITENTKYSYEGEGNEFADTPDPAPALEATLLLRSRNPIWPAAGA